MSYNKKIIVKDPININSDKDTVDDKCEYIMKNVNKDKFTNEQLSTMILYSHNGDILLNSYLKSNRKLTTNIIDYYHKHYYQTFSKMKNIFIKDDNKYITAYIESFYEALRLCFIVEFDKAIIVYRRISIDPKYKKGDIILNKFFISTSCDIQSTEEFGEILLIIEIPKNTKVCPIYLNSKYPDEKEILLKDNTYFYVKEKRGTDYELIIINDITSEQYVYDELNDQILFYDKNNIINIDSKIVSNLDDDNLYLIPNMLPDIKYLISSKTFTLDNISNVNILINVFDEIKKYYERERDKGNKGNKGNKEIEDSDFPKFFSKFYTNLAILTACVSDNIEVLDWWKSVHEKYDIILKYNPLIFSNQSIEVLNWWKNSKLELKVHPELINSLSYQQLVDNLEWWSVNQPKYFIYNSKRVLTDILQCEIYSTFKWWFDNRDKYPLYDGLPQTIKDDKIYINISQCTFHKDSTLLLLIDYFNDDKYILYDEYQYVDIDYHKSSMYKLLAHKLLKSFKIYVDYCIKKNIKLNIRGLSSLNRRLKTLNESDIISFYKILIDLKLNGHNVDFKKISLNIEYKYVNEFLEDAMTKYDFITLLKPTTF